MFKFKARPNKSLIIQVVQLKKLNNLLKVFKQEIFLVLGWFLDKIIIICPNSFDAKLAVSSLVFLFAEQIKKYLCLSACQAVRPRFWVLRKNCIHQTYDSANLLLAMGLVCLSVLYVLVWNPPLFAGPHIKCQPVFLFMTFILRKFYDQSRHFLFSKKN